MFLWGKTRVSCKVPLPSCGGGWWLFRSSWFSLSTRLHLIGQNRQTVIVHHHSLSSSSSAEEMEMGFYISSNLCIPAVAEAMKGPSHLLLIYRGRWPTFFLLRPMPTEPVFKVDRPTETFFLFPLNLSLNCNGWSCDLKKSNWLLCVFRSPPQKVIIAICSVEFWDFPPAMCSHSWCRWS